MTTPLKQVIQAIEEASEVFTSFWDTKTGKTVYLADPLMTDMTEEDKALAAEMENTPEELFGYDFITSGYQRDPQESKERMMQHLSSIPPGVSVQQLTKILKG